MGLKLFLLPILAALSSAGGLAQTGNPTFDYTISIPDPAAHVYRIELHTSGWKLDTVRFSIPTWMPGYYQFMNYSDDVFNMMAEDDQGKELPLVKAGHHTWEIRDAGNGEFTITYNIKTGRQFVANSFVDSLHAYIVPANSFLYVEGHIQSPVSVKINNHPGWDHIVTGLEMIQEDSNLYFAPDFDVLYDSPILLGDLEELPSFRIQGIEHRFVGYRMGNFDETSFMNALKEVVESAVNIIGDIPYDQYTFIGIGPGRGGIEHLNNTTISFDGSRLDSEDGMISMMNFLAHEYFHHYNVKRIRPLELGPFDYNKGSRTNLLWVSEGLSVYYEYLIVHRAGLTNDSALLKNFEQHMNSYENNPGKDYQSLVQASYHTWEDGPFGNQGERKGKTISYYEKGPLVGLLLDLAIRQATQNERSLDQVMQFLYREYYQKKQRGFTDAEFQQACESIAGISLTSLFEYVYTTKPLDYNTYLNYAGLELRATRGDKALTHYSLEPIKDPSPFQESILKSWLGINQADARDTTPKKENPYGISGKDSQWMREATMQQLKGCRVMGTSGTWMHTPDGVGNYGALWTRDFYYMVEYAGDLMDSEEIKASINYLLKGQREDGCMPDRVNQDGKAVYSPGPDQNPMADHALDNGSFVALLLCSYVNQFKDEELFRKAEGKVLKGLDFIKRKDNGLVYNDPDNPQCTYGFTDIVKKTGNLLFSSLLYYRACLEMERFCREYNCGDPELYKVRHEQIRHSIHKLWDENSGMFRAADLGCKQIDIWGSAYAVHVGITTPEQSQEISDYLVRNAHQIVYHGQVRHLPGSDKGWEDLFIPCQEGTYQNGAYWATPLAWIVPVIAMENPALAKKILQDVIRDFQKNGINECVNMDYFNVPNYVASATNVYTLTR